MQDFERPSLESVLESHSPSWWKRYLDDTHCPCEDSYPEGEVIRHILSNEEVNFTTRTERALAFLNTWSVYQC